MNIGNYQRTLDEMERIEKQIELLYKQSVEKSIILADMESRYNNGENTKELKQDIDQVHEELFDISVSICDYQNEMGECQGYLEELAGIDGYSSYGEMCEAECQGVFV